MSMSTRLRSTVGATLPLAMALLLGCDRGTELGAKQAGIVDSQVPCSSADPVSLRREPGGSGATGMTVDFDCQGVPDSVTLDRVLIDGVSYARLSVSHRPAFVFRALDGLPVPVEAVDLDGDGYRDLVLALVDESVVLPLVLRITANAIIPFNDAGLNWRELQYQWSESDDQDACAVYVLPRSVHGSSGRRMLVVRSSQGETACTSATSTVLSVIGVSLRVDSAETRLLRGAT